MFGGVAEIPAMSSAVNSMLDAEAAESRLGIAERPDSGVFGRGL